MLRLQFGGFGDLVRLGRLEHLDFQTMLGGIGGILEASAKERISVTKQDPDGNAWPEWSERYAGSKHGSKGHQKHKDQRREAGGHSLLNLSGALNDSLQWEVEGDEVHLGSPLIYADTQNFGDDDRNIPARPYWGASDEDRQNLEEYVNEFLTEAIL